MTAAESRNKVLYLFRHLLRASSYLPDDFAQVYIRDYIKHQFRRGKKVSLNTPERLRKARSSLNTLQRAGDGDVEALTKVLQRAYGRTGKRRRELVNELLRADDKFPPENGRLAGSSTAESITQDGKWELPRPVLTLFLKSQAANYPPGNIRPQIRHFEPQISKNIWERPMPLNRQRNIVKKFWASTLDKILPPLPELEWNRLRDLATGVIPFEGPPPRRIAPAPLGEKAEAFLDATNFLKYPIRDSARPGKDAQLQQRANHKIDERFMRRMWASLWIQCPLMTYNGETMKWTIVWGGGRSAASQGLVGSAGKKDLELFDGIDELEEKKMDTRKRRKSKMPQPTANIEESDPWLC